MKKIFWAVLLLVSMAGLAIFLLDPFTPLEDKIALHVSRNDPACDPNFPVRLEISNQSRSTITDMAVEVTVRQVGYSQALESQRFDTDKIIEPGTYFSLCVVRPRTFPELANNPLPSPFYTDTYAEFPESSLEYSAKVIFANSD